MHLLFLKKKLTLCLILFTHACIHAQHKVVSPPYRSSFSNILPNKYNDPLARRISVTVSQQSTEHMGTLPDISDIPFAFPKSPPASPIQVLLVSYVQKKKQPSQENEQKKSPTCCTIM